ncbi:MAG: 23S rRNA (adenine(2503)-C(2))-methyltransferase RlmN, partial [Bacteroidetes bacterium]|nr:23S rRNA (adenine(2503)-C(2))-methyltransferase RlmN [Bacteroidota bacterium]
MKKTPNIRALSLEELKKLMESWGEKPFRAKQVYEWLWKKPVNSFSEMSNLSKHLREKLEAEFTIDKVQIAGFQKSNDGT